VWCIVCKDWCHEECVGAERWVQRNMYHEECVGSWQGEFICSYCLQRRVAFNICNNVLCLETLNDLCYLSGTVFVAVLLLFVYDS
jgi:hypothetical protein